MKALLNYVSTEVPVLNKPFTVVDSKGSVWTIASDRVWFVAVKGKNHGPRFQGVGSSLGAILHLLRLEPEEPVAIDRDDVLQRLDPDGLGSVLGVVVSRKRLHDLLTFPMRSVRAWDASRALGAPSLGFVGEGVVAYLMGFGNVVDEVPEFSIVPAERSLFDEIMSLDEQ